MCDVSRRGFLATGAAFLTAAAEEELLHGARRQPTAAREYQELAPGVFFYQADLEKTSFCNSGWVVFDDYVLVIDANYPAGARELIRMIRGVTDKPIRFAFDTHHHGDHAYGNQVFAENGAIPVAHAAVLDEMKRLETGFFGGTPGRWESEAKERDDVRSSRLKPPTLLFPTQLFFDDGKRRVELVHFGTGHTKGMRSRGCRTSASCSVATRA
jgi:cyclase